MMRLLLLTTLGIAMIACDAPQVQTTSAGTGEMVSDATSRTVSWGQRRGLISWVELQDDAELLDPYESDPAGLPPGAVMVPATVAVVDLPLVDSPSIGGERATVTFVVAPGTIPGWPKCDTVRMTYDSYVNLFKAGQDHTLVFLSDGDFYGILGVAF